MLQIQMSRLKLTKIVTILPYFLVVNNTPFKLRYMEDNEDADLWFSLDSGEVIYQVVIVRLLADLQGTFDLQILITNMQSSCLMASCKI